MREGSVFRRCTRCKVRADSRAKRCAKCDHDRLNWCFVVDVAPPGSKKRDQRRGSGYATKAEAVAAAAELQVSKAHGSYVEPSKRTLGQYLEAWLVAGCGGHIRGSTLRHYRQAIDLHIVPRIGHLPLQGLTRLDIKAWCEELRRTGNKRTAGGPLSPKSVHDYFIALRAALEDARLDGLIRTNPAAGVYTLPRHHRPEMLTWTVEELRAFLTYAAHHRDYPLWRTAAQTGMRQGELLGLRWRDLDLDGARAHIRQQWTRQEAALEFGRPKTAAGERTIDLDPGTVEVLRQHMTAQEFERRSWGPAYAELGLVFARPDGSANDPDVVRNRFDRCFTRKVGKAPVPRIRWHDLRHTHATLLIEAGIDVRTVSERLGHSSVNVTLDLYHHVTSKSRQSAATKIGALVDGPGIGDPVVTPGSAARASG